MATVGPKMRLILVIAAVLQLCHGFTTTSRCKQIYSKRDVYLHTTTLSNRIPWSFRLKEGSDGATETATAATAATASATATVSAAQPARTYTPRVAGDSESVAATAPRIYKPKSGGKFAEAKAASKPGPGGAPAGNRASRPSWNPAGSGGSRDDRNSNSNYNNNRDRGSTPAVSLQNPMLLVRYRVPRVKSDLKKELEGLQETFKAKQENSRPSWSGGGGRGYERDDGGASDALFKSFTAPPTSTGFKGGNARPVRTGRPSTGDDDSDARSRGKGKKGEEGLDDDGLYDSDPRYGDRAYSDAAVEYEGGDANGDYYGDEENRGLGSISAFTLSALDKEGYTIEEIQMALYGEYGVKASLRAIRNRVKEDASKRKFRKKTGKTRKDNYKAREARRRGPADNRIDLEEYEKSGIQVQVLAGLLEVGAGEVLKHMMMNMGQMASMTQTIDVETAKQVAAAFGKDASGNDGQYDDDDEVDDDDDDDDDSDATTYVPTRGVDAEQITSSQARSPIVTIMGHVDHGKTTLLDTIRKARVALGEAGGITQAISAFSVQTTKTDKTVTFIDTPGHAAFSDMRKRGANVTDVVILVVAADDGIMDQTKECIAAAKQAGCPIVVAINKIDKEGADPKRIKTDLMSFGLLLEEFGGDCQCVEVSAKQNIGVDDLLEKVLLQAEMMNLKADPTGPVTGSVIEARMDKGLGVVVTALIQTGTLRVGDLLLAGPSYGKVRRLINDQKQTITEAGPSMPVQIVGMTNVPSAGDKIILTFDEADTKEVAMARMRLTKQAFGQAAKQAILSQASGFSTGQMDVREVLKVPLLIKGDVSGSVEALINSLETLEVSDESTICKVDIVYSGVGDVTSSDVGIAAAAKAKIIAFNVAANYQAQEEARSTNVNIGYYDVVYELLEEMEKTVKTTLAPPPPGTLVGRAEIKKAFRVGKSGKVAGVMVTEGSMLMESRVRIMRGKRNPVYEGTFSSIKVVKEAVNEVPEGSECGVGFDGFTDFEEGDIIECFVVVKDE